VKIPQNGLDPNPTGERILADDRRFMRINLCELARLLKILGRIRSKLKADSKLVF
jgi:hypothetical protein